MDTMEIAKMAALLRMTNDKKDEDHLIGAIRSNDLEAVKSLVARNHGKNIDPEVLKTAIENGNLEVIEKLLKDGASSISRCKSGRTPFFYAVASGNLEIIKVLLRAGQNALEDPDLLISAVQQQNCELIQFLICNGADINAKSREGKTAMFHAVELGSVELIQLLVMNNAQFQNDTEVLSLAVAQHSLDVIEILLKNGANPNTQCKGYDLPRFNQPIILRKEDSKQDLFSWSTIMSVHSESNLSYEKLRKGRNPLHLAAHLGREEAVILLLEYGADIDSRTQKGLTPLIIAADRGQFQVVRTLLESGAATDPVDHFNRTAFHAAAMNGHTVILRTLLDFSFSDPEFLHKNGIYRFSYVKRTLFTNALRRNKLDKWKSFVSNIAKHLLKMDSAGFKVRGDLEPLVQALLGPNRAFVDACMVEITKLKTTILGESGLSFFDIMIEEDQNLLALLVTNSGITEFARSGECETMFNIYGSVITSQFRRGETRKRLLNRGAEVSHRLLSDFELPAPVAEKILKNLSNKDIIAFIAACSLCAD